MSDSCNAGTSQDVRPNSPDGWPSQEWCEWLAERDGLKIEAKDGTVFEVRANADW